MKWRYIAISFTEKRFRLHSDVKVAVLIMVSILSCVNLVIFYMLSSFRDVSFFRVAMSAVHTIMSSASARTELTCSDLAKLSDQISCSCDCLLCTTAALLN